MRISGTSEEIAASASGDVYDDGYLRVEHQHFYLAFAGKSIHLPRAEFLMISRLVHSMERVVSPRELWGAAWGPQKPFNSMVLHVYMHRLRNRLAPYELQVDTVVNAGYRLRRSFAKRISQQSIR